MVNHFSSLKQKLENEKRTRAGIPGTEEATAVAAESTAPEDQVKERIRITL